MEEEKTPETFKITCENYPSEFVLDKNIAKEYFRRFGKLKRLTFRPKLRICTVEYANKAGCMNALSNAGKYKNTLFKVSLNKSPNSKKTIKTDPIWIDDDEIEAELKAMAGVTPKFHQAEDVSCSSESIKIFKNPKQLKRSWKPEEIAKIPEKPKKKLKPFEKIEKSSSRIKSSTTVKAPIRTFHKTEKASSKVKSTTMIKAPIRTSSLLPENVQLVNIILSQATTVEEKYRVLDARDKLIRAKLRQKGVSLKTSATVGTCPDMCPEKERLMRETQHQVALYEQMEDSKYMMDVRKAVKQYSRSSADQEMPLPHELRPVAVLQMTMCYLMHNIVDLCDTDDVNLAEWYHFMWDRTRGIRKDITQQELCSQGAVELVEQCARFHIHCSARLVAEEPSVFDQKINTENLTKCLQTLKYMYHDLQLKGENCPNEAEFRAYVILLNLNNSNFMWEVQQLRSEIQKSKEVRFALDIYSAIDKNNYIKFFKLVYSTTYLNACILMRYFVQVRIIAIKTLLKCYSPRVSKTIYPLSELVRLLAFDDTESAIDFMRAHGVGFNEEKTHIIIERNTFQPPDFPYILDRSLNVVESKRVHSVGRVICGRDLPPKSYENHTPQNSFDQKGYLIHKDILEEEDLEEAKSQLLADLAAEPEVIEQPQQHSSPFGQSTGGPSIFANTDIFKAPFTTSSSIFKHSSIIIGGPQTKNPPPSGTLWQGMTWQKPTVPDEPDSAPQSTTSSSIFSKPGISNLLAQQVTENKSIFDGSYEPAIVPKEDTKMESNPLPVPKKGGFTFPLPQAQSIPMQIKSIKPISEPVGVTTRVVTTDLVLSEPSVVEEVTPTVAPFDIKTVLEKQRKLEELKAKQLELQQKMLLEHQKKLDYMKQERIRQMKKKKQEEILRKRMVQLKREEELKELEIKKAVTDVVRSLVTDVDEKYREEKLIILREQMRNRLVKKSIKKWQNAILLRKQRKQAIDCSPVWINTNTLKQEALELRTSSQDLTLALRKRYKYGKPLEIHHILDDRIEKINICNLTNGTLKKRFYDLTGKIQKNIYWKVVLSIPDEEELTNGLGRIEATLENAFDWKDRNGAKVVIEQHKLSHVESVTYCVEKQKGMCINEPDANGIIFIAKDFNPYLQRRIFEHLKDYGVLTKVPIVILLQEYDKNKCDLNPLIEEKIVSDYVILVENLAPHILVNLIEEGLIFLASKVEKPPPLELDTLSSIVSRHLCKEIWKRANSFAKWNSCFKVCLKNPNLVINLYNEALSKLTKIALSSSYNEYAVFPNIFKEYLPNEIPDCLPCKYQYFPKFWKDAEYIAKLERVLNTLRLPQWEEQWPPSNELELEVSMSKYCTKIFKSPDKPFYRIMGVLLQNIDPNENFKYISNVIWTDVIEVLSYEKLQEANLSLKGTRYENKSVFNQYVVVYHSDTLHQFSNSDWFYVCHPTVKKYMRKNYREKKESPEEKSVVSFAKIDIDKTVADVQHQLNNRSNILEIKKELDNFNILLSDLESSMDVAKKISSRFEQELKNTLGSK